MLETEKAYTANIEVQGLEDGVLVGGDNKPIPRIHLSASCILVRIEGIYQTLIR